jgi:hypothetical protein
LIWRGPSNRKLVLFRGKSAKAEAAVPFIDGSAGSGVEVVVNDFEDLRVSIY